ncbi:hypothetical protein EAE32_06905 [Kocuria tytonicola]|uniref:Uncharacterized protein n=1 Tax=Kocuria tytonicola TaxID=2055946 RepID=A0A3L9L9H1_9MICC|nr:hypothetical protein [Kocuria tytonicola]RLY94854.1 hypothetical protein EAE32_06905 [Kocuria tytonicola]
MAGQGTESSGVVGTGGERHGADGRGGTVDDGGAVGGGAVDGRAGKHWSVPRFLFAGTAWEDKSGHARALWSACFAVSGAKVLQRRSLG